MKRHMSPCDFQCFFIMFFYVSPGDLEGNHVCHMCMLYPDVVITDGLQITLYKLSSVTVRKTISTSEAFPQYLTEYTLLMRHVIDTHVVLNCKTLRMLCLLRETFLLLISFWINRTLIKFINFYSYPSCHSQNIRRPWIFGPVQHKEFSIFKFSFEGFLSLNLKEQQKSERSLFTVF